MDKIYAPKPPCPINLGYFYCDSCKYDAIEIATDTDYPCTIEQYPFLGCGGKVGNYYCGYSHLGLRWCGECLPGREKMHSNEFVVVGSCG